MFFSPTKDIGTREGVQSGKGKHFPWGGNRGGGVIQAKFCVILRVRQRLNTHLMIVQYSFYCTVGVTFTDTNRMSPVCVYSYIYCMYLMYILYI